MCVLTVAVGLWEHHAGGLPGERWVVGEAFRKRTDPNVVQSTDFVAGLGTPAIALTSVGLITYFSWRSSGLSWGLLAPVCALAGPIADAIKRSTGPTKFEASTGFLPGTGGSLPSGHAAFVTSLFALVVVLALRRGRRDVAAAAAMPIAAIGPSLVARGAHYPGDVVAGYTLGLGWTFTAVSALLWLKRPSSAAQDRNRAAA